MLSTPVLEAASISITSGWRLSMISAQWRPSRRHVDGRLVGTPSRLVVEGAGENACGGRLADAAHAGQHVALGDAIGGEGVAQRRAPSPPGRSGRRTSAGGTCGRARRRAWRLRLVLVPAPRTYPSCRDHVARAPPRRRHPARAASHRCRASASSASTSARAHSGERGWTTSARGSVCLEDTGPAAAVHHPRCGPPRDRRQHIADDLGCGHTSPQC